MKPLDRLAARDLVLRVMQGGAPWDVALETTPSFARLKGRDRGFAYRLAAATLRHYNLLTSIITNLTGRTKISPPEVAALLRCGLCQILFLDTPVHAAVNTAVDLTPQAQKGLVNAVLRRAAREKDEILSALDLAKLAAPTWLWDDWVRDWGEETARATVLFCLQEPALDITLKDLDLSEDWVEKLGGELHPFGAVRMYESGAVVNLPGYDTGDWWVQDAAAGLPVRSLGDMFGKKVLDLCAAPGGKTLQLAAMGAIVVAVDNDNKRLERVVENAMRCGLSDRITTICADGTALGYRDAFDVVVLDAPCSASGTLRRHPDMWVQKQARDVSVYTSIQRNLLEKSVHYLKVGGVLLYITCSLDKREGEDQMAWFAQKYKNFCNYETSSIKKENRIFPFESQTDGFFFAAFKRES